MSQAAPDWTTYHCPTQCRVLPSFMTSRISTFTAAVAPVCAATLHDTRLIDFVDENRPAMFVLGG